MASSSLACKSPKERSCWMMRPSRVTGCIGGKFGRGVSVNDRVASVTDDLGFVPVGGVDLLGGQVGTCLQAGNEVGEGGGGGGGRCHQDGRARRDRFARRIAQVRRDDQDVG